MLQLARTTGDRNAELNALTGLGAVRLTQGRHEQAADEEELTVAAIRDHRANLNHYEHATPKR